MKHGSKAIVMGIVASFAAGCLDATPVNLGSQEAGVVVDAGRPDGELPIDAYAHPECRACIATDPSTGTMGCGDKLAICRDVKNCIDVYECAYALGCVNKPTQNESIACAIPCAASLGITDVNDPGIQAAIRLTECFHGPCASKCEIRELTAPR